MKCRYCNIALSPLRRLTDGEFCCDDHRHAFHEEQAARTEVPFTPPPQAGLLSLSVGFEGRIAANPPAPISRGELREFKPPVIKPDAAMIQPDLAGMSLARADRLYGLAFSETPADSKQSSRLELAGDFEISRVPLLPKLGAEAIRIDFEPELEAQPESTVASGAALKLDSEPLRVDEAAGTLHPYQDVAHSWQWLRDVWRNAPSDLKLITLLLPVLLAVAVSPSVRSIKVAPIPSGHVQQVVANRWNDLHQSILNRAAVDITDDFRSGLDAWDSRSNLTSSWSYDASGFVQPGPLAVFKPTTDMTDYRFQFLGEIDQKGMGCAFRATDLDNYYAVKLSVVKPGPLPLIRLVRYAVINGKEGRHIEKPLPVSTRADTLYRILVDVRGSDFTIMAQGQVVDFWSDSSLPRGGVGFFCARGEKARVRWVEVSHQYDALGRLCAYLAPYGFEGRNGNWN
jgi:hypothetical protein